MPGMQPIKSKALGLNADQKVKIEKAILEHLTVEKKIQSSKIPNKDKYTQMTQNDAEKTKKFKTIMTKEQYAAFVATFP
jgi:hypothetical protein